MIASRQEQFLGINATKHQSLYLGPKQISSCGDLTLDGSQSSGGGGRNLKYEWSLVSPVDADITAVLDNAMNETKVFINGSLMTSGSTYTFKLGKFLWLSRQFEHHYTCS